MPSGSAGRIRRISWSNLTSFGLQPAIHPATGRDESPDVWQEDPGLTTVPSAGKTATQIKQERRLHLFRSVKEHLLFETGGARRQRLLCLKGAGIVHSVQKQILSCSGGAGEAKESQPLWSVVTWSGWPGAQGTRGCPWLWRQAGG